VSILVVAGFAKARYADLASEEWLREWLPHACALIGMHPIGPVIIEPYAHWDGASPSAIQFLEESSITVHLYHEISAVEVVLHSCRPIENAGWVAEELVADLDIVSPPFIRHIDLNIWDMAGAYDVNERGFMRWLSAPYRAMRHLVRRRKMEEVRPVTRQAILEDVRRERQYSRIK